MSNWAYHGLVQPLLPGIHTPYYIVIYIGWFGSDWIYQALRPPSSFAYSKIPTSVHRRTNKMSISLSFALARRHRLTCFSLGVSDWKSKPVEMEVQLEILLGLH